MKHTLDCCNTWIEERAAQKFVAAYEYLCDVKRQRYEAAFRSMKKDVAKKNSKTWGEAVSIDME